MKVQLLFTNCPTPLNVRFDADLQPGSLGDALARLVQSLRLPGLSGISSVTYNKTPLSSDLVIIEESATVGIRKLGSPFVVGPLNAGLPPPLLKLEGVWDPSAVRQWALELHQQRMVQARVEARAALGKTFKTMTAIKAAALVDTVKLRLLYQSVLASPSRKAEAALRFRNCLLFHRQAARLRQLVDQFMELFGPKERLGAFKEFHDLLVSASGAIQIVHPDDFATMAADTARFEARLKEGREAILGVLDTALYALIVSCMFAHDKSYIVTIGSAGNVLIQASSHLLSFTEKLQEFAKGESNTNVFTREMKPAISLKAQFADYTQHPVGSGGYLALWERLAGPIIAEAQVNTLLEALGFIESHIAEIAEGLAPLPKVYLLGIVEVERRRQREREERDKKEAESGLIERTGLVLMQLNPGARQGLKQGDDVIVQEFVGDELRKFTYTIVQVTQPSSTALMWKYTLRKKQ